MGVNHLTDRTDAEFKKLLGYRKDIAYSTKRTHTHVHEKVDTSALPRSVDWRLSNVVTAVKDQGSCGSCWTFGSAETIESHWALATGALTDLSEQQILDCTPNPNHCGGTGGCGGGTAELAFAQIIAKGGLTSEWYYAYTSYSGQGSVCKWGNATNLKPVAKLSSYVVIPENQYDPLINAIATVGPVAVSVDASSWGAYETGVFNGCNQVNPDIDHLVQLVGYGVDPVYGDYWLVRNSWSPTWGEFGYVRLKKYNDQASNPCGVDKTPSDGSGCDGGPSTVTVCGTCGILYDNAYPIVKV